MATIGTMAILNVKCMNMSMSSLNHHHHLNPAKPTPKPISLLSSQNLPIGLSTSKPSDSFDFSSLTGPAIAGSFFASLSCCESAMAAQQIAEIAEGDNRGLALLIPIIPAILWVLYNILQPALNQLDRMNSTKGVVVGLGLGGLAASSFVYAPPSASAASEIAAIADASSNDSRGLLLLFVITPAVLWVLYNMLQPALNQINRMKSG